MSFYSYSNTSLQKIETSIIINALYDVLDQINSSQCFFPNSGNNLSLAKIFFTLFHNFVLLCKIFISNMFIINLYYMHNYIEKKENTKNCSVPYPSPSYNRYICIPSKINPYKLLDIIYRHGKFRFYKHSCQWQRQILATIL